MSFLTLIVVALMAAWNATVSWLFRLITPQPTVKLPRIILAANTGESARTDLPGQVVRVAQL